MSEKKDIIKQERLLSNLVLFGRVVRTDYKPDTGKVCVRIGAEDEKSAEFFLPWLRRRGGKDWEWWAPEVDEQVLIVSPDGDLNRAVIVGSLPYVKLKESVTKAEKGQRWVLAEGEEPPPDDAKEKKEQTGHVIQYGDETQMSYDKKNHLFQATFLKEKKIKLSIDALKDKEKISIALKDTVAMELDAIPDKENATLKVKEVSLKLDAAPDKEAIDLKIKEDVSFKLNAEKGKEHIDLKVKKVSAKIDATSGSEKATVNVNDKTKLEMNGNGNIKITGQSGLELNFKPDGSATIVCSKLDIKSKGPVAVKGAVIQMNC